MRNQAGKRIRLFGSRIILAEQEIAVSQREAAKTADQ